MRPSFEEITRKRPEKSLLTNLAKHGGRNNRGRVTTRSRGGGPKRMYRVIDFKRRKEGVPGRAHNITNVGTSELITLFWADEIFDPENPDTYFEEVG